MNILQRIKQFVLGEWGQRLGWTFLATALVVAATFGPAWVSSILTAVLALAGFFAYESKADDIVLRGWRRGVTGIAVALTASLLIGAAWVGIEAVTRFFVVTCAFVTLVFGSAQTAKLIEREFDKEFKDD